MRATILSIAVFLGLGCAGYGQNQPQSLKGVFAPPSMSALGQSGKAAPSSGSDLGAVGGSPRITLPGQPTRGELLPNDVTPTPIPGRPGYGQVVVNGRRVIVDLNTNRIFQVLD